MAVPPLRKFLLVLIGALASRGSSAMLIHRNFLPFYPSLVILGNQKIFISLFFFEKIDDLLFVPIFLFF